MHSELEPVTAEGRRAVEIAEKLAADFATRAERHDRAGSFPYENWDSLRESGLLGVTLPAEYGGLGVSSVQDYVCTFSRLARGDGSTALGAMMHAAGGIYFSLLVKQGGDAVAVLEPLLHGLGSGQVVVCPAHSEPGTSVPWWMAEGVPVDGGYKVNGRKIFATNSPIATHFDVFFRVPDGDGGWWTMTTLVERGAPGLTIGDDWDALGMRASGSNSVTFEDCFVPAEAASVFAPWGQFPDEFLPIVHAAVTGQAGVFLGLAEAAREWVVDLVTTRTKAPSGRRLAERTGIQQGVAEMDIDLAVCRAVIERHARLADEILAGVADVDARSAFVHDLQCMKLVATRKAIDVVDKAMQVSGGAGYTSGSPLGRLYRDVRAGPFMQVYSPNEAHQAIGRSALGLDPTPDL